MLHGENYSSRVGDGRTENSVIVVIKQRHVLTAGQRYWNNIEAAPKKADKIPPTKATKTFLSLISV